MSWPLVGLDELHLITMIPNNDVPSFVWMVRVLFYLPLILLLCVPQNEHASTRVHAEMVEGGRCVSSRRHLIWPYGQELIIA